MALYRTYFFANIAITALTIATNAESTMMLRFSQGSQAGVCIGPGPPPRTSHCTGYRVQYQGQWGNWEASRQRSIKRAL